MIRHFRETLAFASFVFMVSFMPIPVGALSPEDVSKKLGAIIVFVLTDERGGFHRYPSADVDLIPLYLSSSDAQARLNELASANKKSSAQLKFFRLDYFYEQLKELRQRGAKAGRKVESRIVSSQADMDKAVEMLVKEGVSLGEIRKGIKTPVFYTEPMIASGAGGSTKNLFFLSYSQLDSAIQRFVQSKPSSGFKLKVADLSVVLDHILKSKDDVYSFVATEDGVKILESLKQ